MKTILLILGLTMAGAVWLYAQQAEEVISGDDPLAWKVTFVQIAWELDKSTDIAVVKKFNQTIDFTLATVDGNSGYVDAGGEGNPAAPRNPFIKLGLLKLQAEHGLLDKRYIHLSKYQRVTWSHCSELFSAMPKTIKFSRLQLNFRVTVYNNTAGNIILLGSGDLPLFYQGNPVVIAKPKEPLNNRVLPPGHQSGFELNYWADLDTDQARLLMAAAAQGFEIDLVRAQFKALQNSKDLRLAMDVNSRRTYKFSISNGDDDLIAWRVKKRVGAGGAELTVAEILEKINGKGLLDDQGKPLLKIKDGRCIGVGTSPVIGKELMLMADHGKDRVFFLWDWPLDTPIQGDVTIRLFSGNNIKLASGVVSGILKYEASTHDPFAQVLLASRVQKTTGVAKNASESAMWFRKAAEQGNGFGMFGLSVAYREGRGVEKDQRENMKWLNKAAERGDPDAQQQLGNFYESGTYVEQSYSEAVKWYRKASDQGELLSQYRLGWCYAQAMGLEKDEREAVKWYRKAADQGHGEAECFLGYCLQKGTGIERDEKEAVKWFRKSAIRGFSEAMFQLSQCYEKGCGIEKNEGEAARWCLRAVKQEASYAFSTLGYYYQEGIGVEKDEREAVKWYRKSAEQGFRVGEYNLGWCYRNGIGVEKDGREAVKWLRIAADKGFGKAYKYLGLCYLEGFGVEKDEAEGIRLLRKAVEMGVTSAQDELKKIGK